MNEESSYLTELNRQVIAIRANNISKSSRDIYINSNAKFLLWLYNHKIHLLTPEFLEDISRFEVVDRKYIKNYLLAEGNKAFIKRRLCRADQI